MGPGGAHSSAEVRQANRRRTQRNCPSPAVVIASHACKGVRRIVADALDVVIADISSACSLHAVRMQVHGPKAGSLCHSLIVWRHRPGLHNFGLRGLASVRLRLRLLLSDPIHRICASLQRVYVRCGVCCGIGSTVPNMDGA